MQKKQQHWTSGSGVRRCWTAAQGSWLTAGTYWPGRRFSSNRPSSVPADRTGVSCRHECPRERASSGEGIHGNDGDAPAAAVALVRAVRALTLRPRGCASGGGGVGVRRVPSRHGPPRREALGGRGGCQTRGVDT